MNETNLIPGPVMLAVAGVAVGGALIWAVWKLSQRQERGSRDAIELLVLEVLSRAMAVRLGAPQERVREQLASPTPDADFVARYQALVHAVTVTLRRDGARFGVEVEVTGDVSARVTRGITLDELPDAARQSLLRGAPEVTFAWHPAFASGQEVR